MNYEIENLNFIDQIKKGETMFDLGACEGRFSLYAALKGIICFAFEPEKNNYQALLNNIGINNLNHELIKPFKLAIGNKNQSGKLKIGQPWADGHQKVIEQLETRNDLNFKFIHEELVEIVSLDDFLLINKIACPDYLKVDIDGSELSFIEGADILLANKKLKGLIFELEINDKNFDHIILCLTEKGFKEENRYQVPNEAGLYNFIFRRIN